MNNQVKTAFRELLKEVKRSMNDTRNSYIEEFLPETGVFESDDRDMDDNGNWGFRTSYVEVSEEGALRQAQDTLVNRADKVYLDEFLFETAIRDRIFDFMKAICKEMIND
jgi:hypothetical protein